jgi:hypothetical protein
MKFLVALFLTTLLAFIAGLYLPWWGIAIAGIVVALLVHQRAIKAWLSGFLGVFILWAGLAWWIDMKNHGILSAKIASVLPMGGHSAVLILVTGIIGGLVTGFAAMSGSYLRTSKSQPHN